MQQVLPCRAVGYGGGGGGMCGGCVWESVRVCVGGGSACASPRCCMHTKFSTLHCLCRLQRTAVVEGGRSVNTAVHCQGLQLNRALNRALKPHTRPSGSECITTAH